MAPTLRTRLASLSLLLHPRKLVMPCPLRKSTEDSKRGVLPSGLENIVPSKDTTELHSQTVDASFYLCFTSIFMLGFEMTDTYVDSYSYTLFRLLEPCLCS
uniref:Uncharacterized protein n=1 Tax=Lygus hesperus TaxID=30085 RepID=A0A146KZN4_LYGHE